MKFLIGLNLLIAASVFAAEPITVTTTDGKTATISAEEARKAYQATLPPQKGYERIEVNADGSSTINWPRFRYNGQYLLISGSKEKEQYVTVGKGICKNLGFAKFIHSRKTLSPFDAVVSLDEQGDFVGVGNSSALAVVTCR